MNVTLGQLRASAAALKELSEARVPAATAMRIALILRVVQPVLHASDGVLNALLIKYGSPIEGQPGKFQIPEGRVPDFRAEEAEALAEVVDVPLPELIKVERLGSIEIQPAALAALGWMITLE